MAKKFSFEIPVGASPVINGLIKSVKYGDIVVSGTYDSPSDFDFDEISWNGMNLFELLENCPMFSDAFSSIEAAVSSRLYQDNIERLQFNQSEN